MWYSLHIIYLTLYIFIYIKNLDRHNQNDVLVKLPNDVKCWYAPKNAFVDELMSKAAKMLGTNGKIISKIKKEKIYKKKNWIKNKYYISVQAADSEINLVHSRYMKNDTSKVLWAIFEIENLTSDKPKVLEYKIRSSEIGESRVNMMHEKEPAYKGIYQICLLINRLYKIIIWYVKFQIN